MKTSLGWIALLPVCLLGQEIAVEPPPPTPKPTPTSVPIPVPITPRSVPQPMSSPSTVPDLATPPPPPMPLAIPSPVPLPIPSPIPVPASPPPTLELYSEGGFPKTGNYYHPQQLAGIAGHPQNAWLIGQLRVVGYQDDHHMTLQTGAPPRAVGQPEIDILGTLVHRAIASHLVTVHVFIVESQQTFEAGKLIEYTRNNPLKIVRVEVDGNRIEVTAQDLLKKAQSL